MKVIKKTPIRPRGRSDEKRLATKEAIRAAYENGPEHQVIKTPRSISYGAQLLLIFRYEFIYIYAKNAADIKGKREVHVSPSRFDLREIRLGNAQLTGDGFLVKTLFQSSLLDKEPEVSITLSIINTIQNITFLPS